MNKQGTLFLQYDAPEAADAWFHGPHYDELLSAPGVASIHRYKLISEPTSTARQYLVLIDSEDIDATLAWRSTAAGKRSQEEAGRHGVTNRSAAVYSCIYSKQASKRT